ncbi:Uncharacterised protein [Chromobacterium violaceum]|uniref:Uncharacterized protein n=1 Tax=Chromobacterium violaceum TaxID=536 RepID=A0A447TG11_CHRVL|nr:hypothetical protein [Chromobacterium violaceum]MBX9266584.1 hypothetical protein [Chromobacterium violaceum]VEB43822.1 Uncharacterised protein [Chromobacterium violaceum]
MKPGNADKDGPSSRNLLQYWLRKRNGSRLNTHDKLHFEPLQEELLLNLMVVACILLLALYTYLNR